MSSAFDSFYETLITDCLFFVVPRSMRDSARLALSLMAKEGRRAHGFLLKTLSFIGNDTFGLRVPILLIPRHFLERIDLKV
jgi:hypothetical protein